MNVLVRPGRRSARFVFSPLPDGSIAVQKRWKARLGSGRGPIRKLPPEHARALWRKLVREGWTQS